MKKIFVTKANGQLVPFDANKVRSTCVRAGASKKLAKHIIKKIYPKLYEGITTREIYQYVLESLGTDERGIIIKHRYRLKEAIRLLGPSGFPFENFVARLLENHGYQILALRKIIQGVCVKHELDIIAHNTKLNKKYFVECKYHNSPGIFTGLKESLYTHARFLDLKDEFGGEMLVCNTKVSDDVITYGRCINQTVISWRYPPNLGLERMIEEKGLYPITILGLSKKEIFTLSQNNMMLAKDLLKYDTSYLSDHTGISKNRIDSLKQTIEQILVKPV